MLDKYFFCYSPKLSNYLWTNGFFCITKAKNLNSEKIFSLYENTPALQIALEEYKQLQNK